MKNQVQYISFFLNLNGLLSSFSIQFLNNVCLISKRGLLQLVSTIQSLKKQEKRSLIQVGKEIQCLQSFM